MDRTIAIVVGTRPEIIKTAILPRALHERTEFVPKIIFTGQHQSMAQQAFSSFGLTPDVDLRLMTADQTPAGFLAASLPELAVILAGVSGVIVQGDTTSALAAALAAFHLRIPVAHIEAGLRTGDRFSPFPEEMNRVLISRLADLHFCPTKRAAEALRSEGINANVLTVGNTVVDALMNIRARMRAGVIHPEPAVAKICGAARKGASCHWAPTREF